MKHLEALEKYFPNGCLFCFRIKNDVLEMDVPNFWKHLHLSYASPSWERITKLSLTDVIQDSMLLWDQIYPDDLRDIFPLLRKSLINSTVFNTEMRYRYANNEIRWFQMTMQPRRDGPWLMCDGSLHDITARKKEEIELSLYRSAMEPLIKERMNELETAKEELTSIRKELERKNIQLHNEILAHMKVVQQLEDCKHNQRTSSK